MKLSKKIKVAIDGPAGAGKSTVARLVAGDLGYVYVDTGAMYRAVTWYALHNGLHPADSAGIADLVGKLRLELKPSEHGQQVWVNGSEVTGVLRNAEVTGHVSQIAQIAAVRQFLSDIQKELAAEGGIVMDGRDIGTQVMPDAELKVFLTASVEERAERRCKELKASGTNISLERLIREISERDRADEEREISPLRQAEDAIYLDCTAMTARQAADRIVALGKSIMNEAIDYK